MQGNVYADTVAVEDESSRGFSEALRKKLRPLRPFVYDLVNRAMRASGRLQQEPQVSSFCSLFFHRLVLSCFFISHATKIEL